MSLIEIKKAIFVEGGYHMIAAGLYIPFDKVVMSTTGTLQLYNNERFTCLVGHESEEEVLGLINKEGIEIMPEVLQEQGE
jgi:hypothetical protein